MTAANDLAVRNPHALEMAESSSSTKTAVERAFGCVSRYKENSGSDQDGMDISQDLAYAAVYARGMR